MVRTTGYSEATKAFSLMACSRSVTGAGLHRVLQEQMNESLWLGYLEVVPSEE